MIFNYSKKGDVGLTLTWFVAFIVIVLMLVVFVITTSFMAVKKTAYSYVGGEGFSELDVSNMNNLEDLNAQRKIEYLLNSPAKDLEGNDVQIKDLIQLWQRDKKRYEDFAEGEVKKVLNELEREEYEFSTENWRVYAYEFFILEEPYPKNRGVTYGFRIKSERYISCVKSKGVCKEVAYVPVSVATGNYVHVYMRKSVAARGVY